MSTRACWQRRGGTLALVAALAIAPAAVAQDNAAPPTPAQKLLSKAANLAFVDVDVYVGDGTMLEKVCVLVENGKVKAVGKDLAIPATFQRIEGGCLAPGFVLLGSTVSLSRPAAPEQTQEVVIRGRRVRMPSRGPSSGGSAAFTPDQKVTAKIQPDAEDWADLLQLGVTTHGMRPLESGLAGLGGAVRPAGSTVEDMVLADEKFLWIGMNASTGHKKVVRENFAKAKELLKKREEAKKAAAAPKPPEKPDAAKAPAEAKPPGPAPGKEPPKEEPPKKEPPKEEPPKQEPPKQEPAKPEQKPEQKPQPPAPPKEDPKLVVLANAIEKKLPVVVGVDGAGELLHGLDALSDTDFPVIVYQAFRRGAADTLDRLLPKLKERNATLVLSADLGYRPSTRIFTNPVKTALDTGITLALVPAASESDFDTLWIRLGELVRTGIPRAKLMQLLTLEPAKLCGVADRVGSIAAGKDANLLYYSRDPFSPAARLLEVYLEGQAVKLTPTRH